MSEAQSVRYILVEVNTGWIHEEKPEKILEEIQKRSGKWVLIKIVEGEHVSVSIIKTEGISLFVRAE
jgi:tellurite resistance-related uncharacterized protein